jgi:hypothetical protein
MAAEVSVAKKARGGRRQKRITHGKPRGQDFAGWADVEETDAEGSNQGRENLEPGGNFVASEPMAQSQVSCMPG